MSRKEGSTGARFNKNGGFYMRITTLRFGELEVQDEHIINFPWGLPGFPENKKFIPINYNEKGSLAFLQSIEAPELTFIIGDPFQLFGTYAIDVPGDDLEALEITAPEEAAVYVILSIREGGKEVTANLTAPLVINTKKQIGRQVILINSPYHSRVPLTESKAAAGGK